MGTLRTLLALSVALGHAGGIGAFYPMHGDAAVQSFYVLSGFYMTMIYREKYAKLKHSAAIFWLNRYLRLAPTFVLVALAAYWASGRGWYAQLDGRALALAFFSHLTMIGQDFFVFLGYQPSTGDLFFLRDLRPLAPGAGVYGYNFLLVPQGWSLGVEAWFYLVAPLILTRRLPIIVAFVAVSFCCRIAGVLALGLDDDPWTYRFFPFELAIFLLGALAYHGLAALRARPWLYRDSPTILAAILVLAAGYHELPVSEEVKHWGFLVLLVPAVPFIFELSKNSAVDRWIGTLSYPIYIVHMLCFGLVDEWPVDGWSLALKLATTLIVSGAIVLTIELPGDRLRARLTRRLGRCKARVRGLLPVLP